MVGALTQEELIAVHHRVRNKRGTLDMKIILSFAFLIGIASCTPAEYSYLASIQGSQGEVEDLRRNRSSRRTSRQNVCEDSSRCENICDRMLEYTDERRTCYKFSLGEIGLIEDAFDILKNPTAKKLESDISSRDFDLFAEVGLRSWNRVITGDYLASQANEDDDDDNDDATDEYGNPYGYDSNDAEAVLIWTFSNPSSIGTSLADFSRSTDILYNLFSQEKDPVADPGLGLADNDRRVIKGMVDIPIYSPLLLIGDKDSPLLEHFHEMVSDICRNASVTNKSRDRSYKICLSWIYFKQLSVSCTSLRRQRGVGYYLLKEGYRDQPESTFCIAAAKTATFDDLKNFNNWSDYWD